MKTLLTVLSATAALIAAPALAQKAPNTCFRTNDIRNHTVVDKQTLYLAVGNNDVYRLTTRGSCASPGAAQDTLITRTTGSSGLVCRPIDLDPAISRTGITTPCIVDTITKLTPAEAKALPKKLRP